MVMVVKITSNILHDYDIQLTLFYKELIQSGHCLQSHVHI